MNLLNSQSLRNSTEFGDALQKNQDGTALPPLWETRQLDYICLHLGTMENAGMRIASNWRNLNVLSKMFL